MILFHNIVQVRTGAVGVPWPFLSDLGVQGRSFSEYNEKGDDFEAEQAILSIAQVALGQSAAALAVVESTLGAMKKMADGSWLKIFVRDSKNTRSAPFQVTVAERAPDGGAMISLLAFELEGKRH